MKQYIKIARVDHWIKNLFILPGIAVAVLLMKEKISMLHVIAGFFATCFIASANYVINEWLDAEFDKFHPTKKFRPVVSQELKISIVIIEYCVFAALGILLSFFLNKIFLYMEIWLLIMGLLYNVKPFRTKDIPYLDVLSESINNMIRLMIGWFLVIDTHIPPASILVGYWMAGAFLMGTKRFAEYRMIGNPEIAGLYRKSFRYYTEKTLLCSCFFYAMCATFAMGIFMIKYRIEYVLSMPLLFLLFSYYLYLGFKEDSAVQKPEKLYQEKYLMGIVLLFIFVLVILTVVDISILQSLHYPYFISIA